MSKKNSLQSVNKQVDSKLKSIELKLGRALNKFYKEHIAGRGEPIEILKAVYYTDVQNLIRKTVKESYGLGAEIVNNELVGTGTDLEFKPDLDLSTSDIVKEQTEQFWKTADKLHTREYSYKVDNTGNLELLPALDILAAMLGAGSWVAITAFSQAVRAGVIDVTNTAGFISVFGAPGIVTSLNYRVTAQLIFMTRADKKVDKRICRPLQGLKFDPFNDTLIPVPPLHAHCRCRLLPRITIN